MILGGRLTMPTRASSRVTVCALRRDPAI
jgi:hypothetical protein